VRGKRISIAPAKAGAAPIVRQGKRRLKPIRRRG